MEKLKHLFVGEGPYCEEWLGPTVSGNSEVGFIVMRQECGYPPEAHIDEEEPL